MSDKTAHKILKPGQITVLRILASAGKPLTFDQIEAGAASIAKTGLLSALGGLYSKGVVTVESGPAPKRIEATVPRVDIDRKNTAFAINPQVRALCVLLGLSS